MPMQIPEVATATQAVYTRVANLLIPLYGVPVQIGIPSLDVVGTGEAVVSVLPAETGWAKDSFHSVGHETVIVNYYVDSERDETGNVVTHNSEGRARALFSVVDPLLDYDGGYSKRYREFRGIHSMNNWPMRNIIRCTRVDDPQLFSIDDDPHAKMLHTRYELVTVPSEFPVGDPQEFIGGVEDE